MKFKSRLAKVLLLIAVSIPLTSFGQERSTFPNLRRNAATVIFCGLGGAVLGLSTLSFYGQPQDHLGNIYLGLGAGLIAGGGYVYYRNLPRIEDNEAWKKQRPLKDQQPVQFAYAWEF